MKLDVKIVLKEGAIVPKKAFSGDACYDLVVSEDFVVPQWERIILPLGFKIELPNPCAKWWWKVLSAVFRLPSYRYFARVNPRSGMSAKGMTGRFMPADKMSLGEEGRFDLDVIHGIIDCNYRGLTGCIAKNHDEKFFIPRGTIVAQMSIEKAYEANFRIVSTLSPSERDSGGFGSTGTKVR